MPNLIKPAVLCCKELIVPRAIATTLFIAGFCCLSIPAQADVIVSTSLTLNGLTISPASGSLNIISPVTASAFATAQDSLGGFDQQFNTVNDSTTSATATTGLANASASASAPALTAGGNSAVNIPEITASASSGGNGGPGSLIGSFEITGTIGTVIVRLSAPITAHQSLLTNGGGVSATSSVTFDLLLPDISGSPELFYTNSPTIGPNSNVVSNYSNTLSTSVMLQADTPYQFIADVDAESSGLSIVPEPSLDALTALVFAIVLVLRRAN